MERGEKDLLQQELARKIRATLSAAATVRHTAVCGARAGRVVPTGVEQQVYQMSSLSDSERTFHHCQSVPTVGTSPLSVK